MYRDAILSKCENIAFRKYWPTELSLYTCVVGRPRLGEKMVLYNHTTRFSKLVLLPMMLLLMPSTLAVAVTHASLTSTTSSSQLTAGYAEFVGTVDVSSLPAPVVGLDQAIALPSFFPNPSALADAKLQAATPGFTPPGQGQKTIITPKGNAFIHVAKTIPGTPGTNPNPCRCSPPDMGLGVSDKFVFQMVNLAGTVYTTSGNVAKSTFSLSDFWFLPVRGGPLGLGMSDPQVVFDTGAHRWYASIIDTFDVNRVNVAVSATDNLLGTFFIYSIRAPTATVSTSLILPDQPYIGYSDDKFLITANDFVIDPSGSVSAYLGAQYWILNKAEMLAGVRTVHLTTNTPDNNAFAIRPAQHLSSTPTAYMVTNCQLVSPAVLVSACPTTTTSTGGGATVYVVSGVPTSTNSATVTTTTVPIAQSGFAPNAQQPGTTTTLDTGDNRVESVVWRNNLLWLSFTDDCIPNGDSTDRACPRVVEISASSTSGVGPLPLQDFDLGLPGAYAFYASLSIAPSNNLVVVYGTSSSTVYPSLQVTGQLPTMSPNTLGPVV